jgi:Mg/Co/Ni transporter MgtE
MVKESEDSNMKTKHSLAKRGLYIGAGIGLVLFAIVGLLPSSFIGGVLGLKIAGHIFGIPLGTAVAPRFLVGLFMVLGVLVTGLVFVIGLSLIGWASGTLMESLREKKLMDMDVEHLETKEKKA